MEMYTYETEHIEQVRRLAPECMVLLKSDGQFPLTNVGNIALYGNGARRTIKGGTGSGDVNVRKYTTVEEGLKNAGFTLTTEKWLDAYDKVREKAHKEFQAARKAKIAAGGVQAFLDIMGEVMPEPEYELPMEGEGDTAVYVLGRVSGEGKDRVASAGDFLLNNTEIQNILRLAEQYPKFMLVLNVGGVVDLSQVADKVPNILLMSQLGIASGDALADVILGRAYPSGKLASTWASWEDYCKVGDFGEQDDTRYREGIYVGYRYFDSVGKKPLYPFGYGLGYTEFSIVPGEITIERSHVTVTVQVRNEGKHPGKEIIQLYVSMPEGKLDQPYQVLAAFKKTKELEPGESQTVEVSFSMENLASFDEESCTRILEAGEYVLRIGNSSRNTYVAGKIHLTELVVTEILTHVGGQTDFTDWKPESLTALAVSKEDAEKENGNHIIRMDGSVFQARQSAASVPDREALETAKLMTDNELIYICTGAFANQESTSVIGNAGMAVAGAAGETTGMFTDKGIPRLVMADGPAGLRLSRQYGVDEQGVYSLDADSFEELKEILPEAMLESLQGATFRERTGEIHYQYCTAIPIGTALAQSWNTAVCEECGDIVGDEMERFGVHLWLAPALNIHRNPLCGRNFEYYSEDPLISGQMAAGITRGTQKHPGCGVTVKHFACNNQETNRFRSNSIVNQRALRDIYLKGFEIVVKEVAPHAVMSSYNLLNGEHTSQRYDLLETVLRGEWGYEGIVMSDWVTSGMGLSERHKYPGACASGSIKAGNDIMMPGGIGDYEDMERALHDASVKYPLSRTELEKCAARMIAVARKLLKDEERDNTVGSGMGCAEKYKYNEDIKYGNREIV